MSIEQPFQSDLFQQKVLPYLSIRDRHPPDDIGEDPIFSTVNEVVGVPTAIQLSAQVYAMTGFLRRWFFDEAVYDLPCCDNNLATSDYTDYYMKNPPVVGVMPDFTSYGIRAYNYQQRGRPGNPVVRAYKKAVEDLRNMELVTVQVNAFLPIGPTGPLKLWENSGSISSFSFIFVLRSASRQIYVPSHGSLGRAFQDITYCLASQSTEIYRVIADFTYVDDRLTEYNKMSSYHYYRDLVKYAAKACLCYPSLKPWLEATMLRFNERIKDMDFSPPWGNVGQDPVDMLTS